MTTKQRRTLTERWRAMARRTAATAELAFVAGDWRSAASRAYYAVYQAATGGCIAHKDETSFPPNWHNPSHDQLPDLIRNDGDLSTFVRQRVSTFLISLRASREAADYRPGMTVERQVALESLQTANTALRLLGVLDNATNGR